MRKLADHATRRRGRTVLKTILHSRARHLVMLTPLGLATGAILGALFDDLVYGLLAGLVLGLAFSGLLALRVK